MEKKKTMSEKIEVKEEIVENTVSFMFRLADAALWRKLVSAMAPLVDEGMFHLNPEGITVRAMDPSHVAMVDAEWPKILFEEYHCETSIGLCVNIGEMLKLLRRLGNEETLELNYMPQTAKINLLLKGSYLRTFSMATLEPAMEEVPTPKVTFASSVKLTSTFLRNALEDAAVVSDQVDIEVCEEWFMVKASGDVGTSAVMVEKGSEELLSLAVEQSSKATYSLAYLLDIVKAASPLSDIVTVEFSSNMPIRLGFELSAGTLRYYLAPRIDGA